MLLNFEVFYYAICRILPRSLKIVFFFWFQSYLKASQLLHYFAFIGTGEAVYGLLYLMNFYYIFSWLISGCLWVAWEYLEKNHKLEWRTCLGVSKSCHLLEKDIVTSSIRCLQHFAHSLYIFKILNSVKDWLVKKIQQFLPCTRVDAVFLCLLQSNFNNKTHLLNSI